VDRWEPVARTVPRDPTTHIAPRVSSASTRTAKGGEAKSDLEALTEKLGAFISGSRGMRIERIGKAIGAATRDRSLPARKLIAAKRVSAKRAQARDDVPRSVAAFSARKTTSNPVAQRPASRPETHRPPRLGGLPSPADGASVTVAKASDAAGNAKSSTTIS